VGGGRARREGVKGGARPPVKGSPAPPRPTAAPASCRLAAARGTSRPCVLGPAAGPGEWGGQGRGRGAHNGLSSPQQQSLCCIKPEGDRRGLGPPPGSASPHQLRRQAVRHGHQLGRLVRGVTKHDALVARADLLQRLRPHAVHALVGAVVCRGGERTAALVSDLRARPMLQLQPEDQHRGLPPQTPSATPRRPPAPPSHPHLGDLRALPVNQHLDLRGVGAEARLPAGVPDVARRLARDRLKVHPGARRHLGGGLEGGRKRWWGPRTEAARRRPGRLLALPLKAVPLAVCAPCRTAGARPRPPLLSPVPPTSPNTSMKPSFTAVSHATCGSGARGVKGRPPRRGGSARRRGRSRGRAWCATPMPGGLVGLPPARPPGPPCCWGPGRGTCPAPRR
jgi:hypothetical protein